MPAPDPILADTGAQGDDVKLKAADGAEFAAYLAQPGEEPEAQIVILPDVRGLHTFYPELADRFAEMGVRALAIDYFSRTAENDDRSSEFEYAPHVEQMTPESFGHDLAAAVEYLRGGSDLPTFVVGFCMGGTLSFWSGTRGLQLRRGNRVLCGPEPHERSSDTGLGFCPTDREPCPRPVWRRRSVDSGRTWNGSRES